MINIEFYNFKQLHITSTSLIIKFNNAIHVPSVRDSKIDRADASERVWLDEAYAT